MRHNEFTNFQYRLIESSVPNNKAVEVSYEFNGKQVKHYIFIREGKDVDYIAEAKKKVEKELNNGKLSKVSKRYFRPNRAKNLKAVLITTFAIGAVTLSGLLTWKHFQVTAEQQAIVKAEEVSELVKKLSTDSLEDEIKRANEAYNNLSDEEKAKVPTSVVKRLEEQTKLFNEDKTLANNLDTAVEGLDGVTDTEQEIKHAVDCYNEIKSFKSANDRLKRRKQLLKVHNFDYYFELIGKAITQYEVDEDAAYEYIDLVEEIYEVKETCSVAIVSMCHTKRNIYITNDRREAIVAATKADEHLNEIDRLIEKENIDYKNYEAGVEFLEDNLSSFTGDDLARVETLQEEADKIQRMPTRGYVDGLNDRLNTAKREYEENRVLVEAIVEAINDLDPLTCSGTRLAELDEELKGLETTISREDLKKVLAKAREQLNYAMELYEKDAAPVLEFEAKIQAAETEIEPGSGLFTYMTFEDETIKVYEAWQESLLTSETIMRREDLASKVEMFGMHIVSWRELFDNQTANTIRFESEVDKLVEKEKTTEKCTNEQIAAVENIYPSLSQIVRASLFERKEKANAKLIEIRANYNADAKKMDDFASAVKELATDQSKQTKENLDALNDLHLDIETTVLRKDLKERQDYKDYGILLEEMNIYYNNLDTQLRLFIYGNESNPGLYDLVQDELNNHNSTNEEIAAFEEKIPLLKDLIKPTDLRAELELAEYALGEVRAAWQADADRVDEFIDLVEDLHENHMDDCSEEQVTELYDEYHGSGSGSSRIPGLIEIRQGDFKEKLEGASISDLIDDLIVAVEADKTIASELTDNIPTVTTSLTNQALLLSELYFYQNEMTERQLSYVEKEDETKLYYQAGVVSGNGGRLYGNIHEDLADTGISVALTLSENKSHYFSTSAHDKPYGLTRDAIIPTEAIVAGEPVNIMTIDLTSEDLLGASTLYIEIYSDVDTTITATNGAAEAPYIKEATQTAVTGGYLYTLTLDDLSTATGSITISFAADAVTATSKVVLSSVTGKGV